MQERKEGQGCFAPPATFFMSSLLFRIRQSLKPRAQSPKPEARSLY